VINYCTTEAAILMFKFLLYFCLTSSLTTVFCYSIPEIPELKSGGLISFIWCLRFSFHVNQFSYLYWCGIMSVNQWDWEDTWCFKWRCENICPKIEEVTYEKLRLQKHHNLYSWLNIWEWWNERNGWGLYEMR